MKTLFYGGKIITMEEPLYQEALLVEDGKILALGSENDLREQAGDCEKVNLRGGALLPGFIDPHSHFIQVAMSLLQVSLDGAETPEEIGERIVSFVLSEGIEPGQWVVARDYDNNLMPDLKNPTLAQLDAFVPHNPLVIHHKSGHMGLMNSMALEKLGITPETPSPEGGRIEVVDGKLTGYLEENAFIECIKKIPMAGPAELMDAVVRAQDKYASYGITTMQDGMVMDIMLPLFQMIRDKGLLKLDLRLFLSTDVYEAGKKLFGTHNTERIQASGMKIFLDGSPQGRTAWMREPYEGSDDYCGYGTLTDEAVEKAMISAAEHDAQLICHCNGDAAAEQFLRCLEKTEKEYPNLANLRPVIIHGQLMGRDQLARAAKLGAMVSFFVAHTYHWGDVHLRNFGQERGANISPAASALKNGVKFTFHQDSPVIEPDMLETIWCATNRITKKGVHLNEAERISTLDALRAITVNAAYQYFEEDQKGSLAPGKVADLVLLSEDPLTVPVEDLRKIKVLKTYKEGMCIYTKA